MSMQKCKECGADISSGAKKCPQCGKKLKHTGSIVAMVVVILVVMVAVSGGKSDTNNTTIKTSSNINEPQKDLSKVIYEDDEFLVKIVKYEYLKTTGNLKVNMYIENNGNTDTNFTIDGDVSINNTMVKGGYMYQAVNANSKANVDFTLRGLRDNGIDESNLSEMQFKFDIYQSKNYMINNRIVDDLVVIYNFK